MVTAVVAACAALAACGLLLLVLRRGRIHADRKLDAVLVRVDQHLQAISDSIADAVEAAVESRPDRSPALLTLDFDELLDVLVVEAAARTGADAAIVRAEGPGGRPVLASFGAGTGRETLDRSFGPPDERQFAAALVDWTYTAAAGPADVRFESALVVPLAPATGVPGALAVYARSTGLGREHAAELTELLREAAIGLSNARRFAELEQRVNVDPGTGVLSRRGYELELDRATARSNRTGRPLSVVVVSARDGVGDVARLVTQVTRRSDISCRREEHGLAILLPGTASSGAAALTRRIEDAATHRFATDTSTVTVGVVEYVPNESAEAFDERIAGLVARPAPPDALRRDAAGEHAAGTRSPSPIRVAQPEEALHRDALVAVAREWVEASRFGRSLAVVALEVDGLDAVTELGGEQAADDALGRFAGRLDRSLGAGSAHRLGRTAFALVLPGSGVHEAEGLVDALQTSLEPPHGEDGLVLTAGITELGEHDDAGAGLSRAQHALWQAAQAGPGTVVVAVPNRRPLSPDAP